VSRPSLKTKSKTNAMTAAREPRLSLFGPPQVLEGEDVAAYDELLARIRATVGPVDIIDEMFIADVVTLEWEVLRWRRLKWNLIRTPALKVLEDFLDKELDYDLYSRYFTEHLREILEDNLPNDQTEGFALTLARKFARNEPDADDQVNQVLARIGLHVEDVLHRARIRKAKELVQKYAQREADAVTLVDELFTRAGKSMDVLMTNALAGQLDDIERIDRLTTIAENRRNASLHEIDRRRALLGETLRRSVQEIEDGEFEVIETTPAKGKNAA
jgi:hypothetical protein